MLTAYQRLVQLVDLCTSWCCSPIPEGLTRLDVSLERAARHNQQYHTEGAAVDLILPEARLSPVARARQTHEVASSGGDNARLTTGAKLSIVSGAGSLKADWKGLCLLHPLHAGLRFQ